MIKMSTAPRAANAKHMSEQRKQRIALEALSNIKSIRQIAREHGVSRRFVRRLRDKAQTAVNDQFGEADETVLFTLPVTKKWIEQCVLSLGMTARASYRESIYFINTMFDYNISIGKISSIFKLAIDAARAVNDKEDLSNIRVTANDELYHLNKPILNGIDVDSLYCHTLSYEQQRDTDSWAIHFLDAQEKGLDPETMISDEASGLLEAHQFVFTGCRCYYDNFHLSRALMDLRRFYRNRLKSAVSTAEKYYHILTTRSITDADIFDEWALAMDEQKKLTYISSTIDTLISWLEHDVLNKAGIPLSEREALYDFIVEEFKKLEKIETHRIQTMRITLENKKPSALAFVSEMDDKFKAIAEAHGVPTDLIWEFCRCLRCSMSGDRYAIETLPLQDQLGDRYDEVEDAVIEAMSSTERTSSMVENRNGQVRRHITFRQEIGHGYLDLLRFYLNHKPIDRSIREHRHKKTPAEILSGKPHLHWLELLGYERFKRTA